jgi:hypothetical protein
MFYTLNFSKPFKLHPGAVLYGGFATVTMVMLQYGGFDFFFFYLFLLNL